MNSGRLQITGNDRDVRRAFLRTEVALSGASLTAWIRGQMDPYLRSRATSRFASEGDGAVGAWQPLAPATVEIRQNMGFGGAHPINRRTGQLQAYITGTPGTMVMGDSWASVSYLGNMPGPGKLRRKIETAQVGGGTNKNAPARPVMGLDSIDLATALAGLSTQIVRVMRGGDP